MRIEALGARYSITDITCTDRIPVSMRHFNYAIYNQDGTATFGAGIEVGSAMEFLEQQNRTIPIVPAYSIFSFQF